MAFSSSVPKILGSCGGYNNLNEVLNISADAHIISSKQVGTKTVNEPILKAMNNILLNGLGALLGYARKTLRL